jgi:hypothetical protein
VNRANRSGLASAQRVSAICSELSPGRTPAGGIRAAIPEHRDPPLGQTDLVGPMRLRVPVSTELPDLTLFAGVRKFHDRREVLFEGSYGFTEDIVTRGWLRASQRAVDES